MHQIKQIPEDFIVKEISNANVQDNGQYSYYLLKKTNYTTVGALEVLSKKLNVPLKSFGFAGNKDKNAITEQKISIFKGSKSFENIELKGIELKYLANGKEPVSLGDLEGNEFTVTVRNLGKNQVDKIKNLENKKLKIPNLYGPQRFSRNNHLVGKSIIKRDFSKAVSLILENDGIIENKIRQYLNSNKNNYIGALRLIPHKTLRLFVNSYQSLLFNEISKEYLKCHKNPKNLEIPIIGFSFELSSIKDKKLKKIAKNIIESEKITPRDCIISQIPELSSEGGSRNLFFEIKDLKIVEIADDNLNQNRLKIKINFTLPKSCYATVALEYVFKFS